MSDYYCLPFSSHPLRDQLYDELHARPFRGVTTPQQISHLAFKANPLELNRAFELVCELCQRFAVEPPEEATVSFWQDCGPFTIRWDRHMEFYALTLARKGRGALFKQRVLDQVPENWLASLPGQAVAALHLEVIEETADLNPAELEAAFEGQRLVLSEPKAGKALICSAFRLHSDGFGRILIQNRGMDECRMGRLVQRIYEMETYRLFAQLAIPIAKRLAPELHEMDGQLAAMLARIPTTDTGDAERHLLEQLSLLSTRLETWRAETNARFSATWAYRDLVMSRLENIREDKVEGHMTMAEFLSRRFNPGLRTCESVQNWLEDLSKRIERAGDLLRTRVNLTLQEQNKDLLATMNRRSDLQFRLQETVEGLSVAAISYYLIGLISYVLSGLPLEALELKKKVVIAWLVPLILVTVWWGVKRIKERLIKNPLGKSEV
jgi:uncharacterized membrane-anchored protein